MGNAQQGDSVSLSTDGNTAIVGGSADNSSAGAIWVWKRSGGVWTQQGTKLVGSGAAGNAQQGQAVSLSADGNTAIIGGRMDNNGVGAAWVFAAPAPVSPPGTVVAWGYNSSGQTTVPVGLSGVTAIAAGDNHTVALKSDGTVVAWGDNFVGQTLVPAGLSSVMAIAAKYGHTVALKRDGTVVAWGFNNYGQATVPAGLSGVTAIAAGGVHNVALKTNGTVVAWGWNYFGQTNVPAGLSGVTAISAGYYHSVALKSDGTVVAWGGNDWSQTNVPAGLSGVTAIAAGYYHSVALKSDGTVVAWGFNSSGQTTVPVGLRGVTAIAAGIEHTVALKSDGTVVAWGRNNFGQTNVLAGLSGVTAISAGAYHTVALVGTAPALGSLNVSPNTPMPFGAIQAGQTADRTFTISNLGSSIIPGTASVASPFSIVSGGSYTLAPGQSQTVTVRYAPTAIGTHAGYVSFSGGGGATRQVTGSAFNDPTSTTGTIAGRVTRSDTHAALNGVAISAVGPGANLFNGGSSAGAVSGVIEGQAGRFSLTGLTPFGFYHVLATAPGQEFGLEEVIGVSVVAGQTTTVNIELTPVPGPSQPPTLTPEQTPVVLVRGSGPNKKWEEGESETWAAMRSALAAQGFQQIWDCNEPDNDADFPINNGQGEVINGEESIFSNAAQLRNFVEQKAKQFHRDKGYYPPGINIVTHSMGGLITRSAMVVDDGWTFSGASGEWLHMKVNTVVMLGTPNAGSALADLALDTGLGSDFFYRMIGWQPSWAATSNLTTHYVRNTFNPAHIKWPAGVKLYLVGGGGWQTSSDGWLRTGGSALASEPPVPLNWLLPPEWVSDGAVTWPSLQGKFCDRSWLQLQQHTSVTLPTTVAPKFFSALDHSELTSAPEAAAWVVGALRGTVVSSGPAKGPRGPHPFDLGTDSLPMQQFEEISGTLAAGTTNVAAVVSDAVTTMEFGLLTGTSNVAFRLQTPGGAVMDTNTPAANTNVQYSVQFGVSNLVVMNYSIKNPATGVWQAVVDGTALTVTQAVYNLMAFGDSSVALIPQMAALFNLGQDVVVNCGLADLSNSPATPVQNAAISARVQFPDGSSTNLTLRDDGLHNDGPAGDGVYAAVLSGGQSAGDYVVAYRATGTNAQGQPLQRVNRGAHSISSGRGALWGDPVYATVDTNADGLGDFLQVKCWVNPTAAGYYILSGELVNAAGTQRFAKSSQFSSDGSGPMMVALMFDLAGIRAAAGQGKFHIENLHLFELKSTGAVWLDTYYGSSEVQLGPAKITVEFDGTYLHLSWPVDCLGWELQTQTSSLGVGLGTNWFPVPDSTSNTQMSIPIDRFGTGRFYRLHYQ